MKITVNVKWDLKDIVAGLYFIKNTSPLGSSDLNFATTVVFKIGFNASEKGYTRISCLTDGMHIYIGNKEDMLKYLNDNDCRPLRRSEYIELINSTNQGFINY